MKEFTIKLVSDRLADLRDSHKLRTAQLKNHNDHVAKLTAELADLQKQIADLEADLQASNITVTEVAERTAFGFLQANRIEQRVKSFAGGPEKTRDGLVRQWKVHHGGPRPVKGSAKVAVLLRTGGFELTGPAERFDWSHSKALSDADVIFWREVN